MVFQKGISTSTSTMDKPKTTPVIHERPKMPKATWEALRNHIIKGRRRKQEEEGKAEEYERQKKERENKKMLEATTLGETKEQISKLEEKLTNLKEEKHQLFLTLKKVLNEDETRRRKETNEMNILYPQHGTPVFPLSGHVAQNNPQLAAMYLHPQSRQPTMYLKPHTLPPAMPPAQPIKRQRTPSPPRSQLTTLASTYFRSVPITSHGRVGTSSVYGHPAATASGAPIYAMSSSSSGFHFPTQGTSTQAREDERKQPVYLSHQAAVGARYVTSLHQQLEAVNAKSSISERERGRIAIAAPAAHSQPIALTTTRTGSITSGYPVRTMSGAVYVTTLANAMMTTTASPSLPPRLAYTQAAQAAAQLVAAQQMAAQQAAAQAAAGGPPTTRYYAGSLHGREV